MKNISNFINFVNEKTNIELPNNIIDDIKKTGYSIVKVHQHGKNYILTLKLDKYMNYDPKDFTRFKWVVDKNIQNDNSLKNSDGILKLKINFSISESKEYRQFSAVSNKDLKPFIKHCSDNLTLPKDHFKHKEAIRILNGLIEEIDFRIASEEKTDRDRVEQMTYDIIKEIVEESGEIYYSADILRELRNSAEEILSKFI